MAPVPELWLLAFEQAQVGFVHQVGGQQSVPGAFLSQLGSGNGS